MKFIKDIDGGTLGLRNISIEHSLFIHFFQRFRHGISLRFKFHDELSFMFQRIFTFLQYNRHKLIIRQYTYF